MSTSDLKKYLDKISFKLRIWFPKIKKIVFSKNLIRVLIFIGLIFVFHIVYTIYSLYKYEKIIIDKKDFKTRTIIKSRFPENYDVNILTADLVGLGDEFYIAYCNMEFVKNAYYFYGDSAIAHLKSNIGKANIPILKFFYIREPGLISALFSITPFSNVENSLFELRIKEYASYSFVPLDGKLEDFETYKLKSEFGFPRTFMISNASAMDVDFDNKDEVIVNYLDYYGGSGGTKFSAIYELIDDSLIINQGFPDLLDVEFSHFLQAIYKYSGIDNPNYHNYKLLESTIDMLTNIYKVDSFDKLSLLSRPLTFEKAFPILSKINFELDTMSFIEIDSRKTINMVTRHTDNFSEFVNINGKYVFLDSFYIYDENCHWCPHSWRIMSFIYRNGRWISDRNINGDYFDGIWLNEKKQYTLNEIFGTVPDQGILGIAYSFINPDWTVTSKYNISDPWGTEMRLQSPVIKKVNEIYALK